MGKCQPTYPAAADFLEDGKKAAGGIVKGTGRGGRRVPTSRPAGKAEMSQRRPKTGTSEERGPAFRAEKRRASRGVRWSDRLRSVFLRPCGSRGREAEAADRKLRASAGTFLRAAREELPPLKRRGGHEKRAKGKKKEKKEPRSAAAYAAFPGKGSDPGEPVCLCARMPSTLKTKVIGRVLFLD